MSKNISLNAPNIGKEEKKYLNRAVDSNFVSAVGPFVPLFEDKFAKFLEVKKTVSVQSGTAALHMALHELGISKGDEVIVPALTFIATVNPILYVGAKPVFADVSIDTWNIDPECIKKNITNKTKAILAVHLYGNPCNMKKIKTIAKKHKLFVIEDATESLGAKYRGKYTGTFGDFACFSFNGNKIMTTGGGGMITGKNIGRLEHIKFLANQGKSGKEEDYFPEIGFNYRMTNIEAAIGIAQMEKLKKFLVEKRKFNSIYRNALKGINGVSFQKEEEKSESSYWFTCVKLDGETDINKLRTKLSKRYIPTRRIFRPVTDFPFYRQYRRDALKNSYEIYKRGLCLPSGTLNSYKDIEYASDILCEELAKI